MLRWVMLGTDTDVGKTFVTAALCNALLRRGLRVAACKPVETGGDDTSDLETVGRACGNDASLRLFGGRRFQLAAAPSAAARAENESPATVMEAVRCVRGAERGSDAVVVEACGGALTPLSASEYVADVSLALPEYRTVLVAGLRLGVLSHALAAVEYLRARRCNPVVVLNDRYESSPAWFVEATREDLASRNLEPVAYVPNAAAPAEVDLSNLIENEMSSKR